MICETCGNEHDGTYGSGRFCSKECRGAFVAKGQRTGKRREQHWKCDQCDLEFESRRKLYDHKHKDHGVSGSWNKGKTKITDQRILTQSNTYKKNYADGKFNVWCKGKHLSDEMKSKISYGMKKAHSEGRAHNIGESRWSNEPSYPEKWFMGVIENEFQNKSYSREFPFHKFSLDFAWIDLKKCIEIDGDQHYRFEEYKKRDLRKDELLLSEGWKILRLCWKEVFKEPKKYIQIAKDFIEK